MFDSYFDIYIESLIIKDEIWIGNSDSLLDEIWDYLNDIVGFSFVSISYNQAKVFKNVSIEYKGTNLYIKGCMYQGKEFLDKSELNELSHKIIEKLLLINNVSFSDVKFRTNLFLI